MTTAAQLDSPCKQHVVTRAGGRIVDIFTGIQSACYSRSVLFPVRISVPIKRVFKEALKFRSSQELERTQHRSTGRWQEAVEPIRLEIRFPLEGNKKIL